MKYELKESQIAMIASDIASRGVSTAGLQESLLDHICILMEEEMKPGADFDTCYRKVIRRFNAGRLHELETETQLLSHFKDYYGMKKIMLLIGTASASLVVIGGLFKVMHWPFASIMLVLGAAGVGLLFLPMLCYVKLRESK